MVGPHANVRAVAVPQHRHAAWFRLIQYLGEIPNQLYYPADALAWGAADYAADAERAAADAVEVLTAAPLNERVDMAMNRTRAVTSRQHGYDAEKSLARQRP